MSFCSIYTIVYKFPSTVKNKIKYFGNKITII